VRTNSDALSRARQAFDHLESAWRGRLDRMADLLARDGDRDGTVTARRLPA
jgi:hypothetical protein